MGTWGYGIFENDVAVDVRLMFEDEIDGGSSVEEATKHVLAECVDYLEDMDDSVQAWLALASLQLEQGSVQDPIRKKALEVIEQGADLERWHEAGTEAVEARRGVLERSEERRVGKEGRWRWGKEQKKKRERKRDMDGREIKRSE